MASAQREEVVAAVREYLLQEVLPGEDPSALTDQTPLVSSGVLDSISTARLVTFLEDRFAIRFKASEVSAAHLDTVALITNTVEGKLTT